jgi:serine phosphatase RsbU (regulator of sigma subunit)
LVFSLPADPRAAASARRRVREHLSLVTPSVVEDVLMAVSELVTNAVRHGEGSPEVRVRQAPRVLRVEVFDAGRWLPQPAEVTHDSLGGRGLHVVGEVATCWGTTLDGTGPGKAVWCEFDIADDVDDTAEASGTPTTGGSSETSLVLSAAENASPVAAVEAVTRELGRALRALSVSFLIADVSGRGLVRLAHVPLAETATDGAVTWAPATRWRDQESATTLPFDGSIFEQAVRTQTVQVLEEGPSRGGAATSPSWLVLAPMTERGESIGLLELRLPTRPSNDEVEEIATQAHLLAFVVIANSRHTDLFAWGQRSTGFSLSAEIQQRLLPAARTCEAGAFTLSGWLEPAADIAGDTYDYSLARDELFISMTDAMGHGVGAALTATLCVGSLRNQRRSGATLLDQAAATNRAVAEHGALVGLDDFVTGLVGRLDLQTGVLRLVNAGHVAPFLARDGHVAPLNLPADLPFGMFADTAYTQHAIPLEPGDRVIFLTDGMLERSAADLDLPAIIAQTHALHAREAVRQLTDRVLEATGHALRDDATTVCLDWHGGHDTDRHTTHGADRARASTAVGPSCG